MRWDELKIAEDFTHHLLEGRPAYAERFDEVLKFHEPGLAPVRRGGTAWHIRPDGQEAYGRRFQRTFGFYEGLAAVNGESGWRHIHPDGSDAYSQRYSWCGNFQGGRCTVRQFEGKYLHIKPNGESAYQERWRYAGDFSDGVSVVQAEDGRSTHIDEDGQQIHGQWFLDLDVFHKGFARARDDSGWMHVDRQGKPAYSRRFAAVEPFYNGQARVERFDGRLEVIDESGKTMVELRPPLRSEFAALSGDMVGFWRTRAIAAAVELGIFEKLPGPAGFIASECGLIPERAHRLLRALAELSLVDCDGEVWHPSQRGRYLQETHPLSLAGAALEYGRYFTKMWEALPEAIKENGNWKSPDVFGDVARNESRREIHHLMLRRYALHDYVSVPDALGLNGEEVVIDAGGGLGVLAGAITERYPNTRLTLLDRPEVIDQAKALDNINPRIELMAGDLFSPWGLRADAVVLARILHDWDNAHALQILHQARSALLPSGKLFLVEMVVPENRVAGSLCDLHLLMATGGQERTASEYGTLMEQSGFKLTEVRRIAALPSILVGVPK